MSTKTKGMPRGADPIAAAQAELDARRARLQELRDEIGEWDGIDQEAGRAVARAVAENGVDAVDSLSESRRSFRDRLEVLHDALPLSEQKVLEAEVALREAIAAEARAEYGAARAAEDQAAQAAERAVTAAAAALATLHELGRASYALGHRAGTETSLHYRRRLSVREAFVRTLVGEYSGERIPNHQRVEELAERLSQLLPPIQETSHAE